MSEEKDNQLYIQELEAEIEKLKDDIWRLEQNDSETELKITRKITKDIARDFSSLLWDLEHI